MSTVAEEITRISGCREDIKTAIAAKGVTVPTGAKLADCPALIASITGGGGPSEPTAMVNTGFTATGYKSAYVPFTAEQIPVTATEEVDIPIGTYQTAAQGERFSVSFDSSYFVDPGASGFEYIKIGFNNDVSRIRTLQFGPTDSYGDDFYPIPVFDNTSILIDWSALCNKFEQSSASWQWSIQGSTLWFIMYDSWYAATSWTIEDYYIRAESATGTAYPYPSYPVTTTGYVQNTMELEEYFTAGNVKFSGKNQKIVNYDSSPSDSTANTTPTANVTSFVDNGLKDWQALSTFATDDNYTYSYGSVTSGYSGYTGI